MDNEQNTNYDPFFVRNMIESFLRIGLLLILLVAAYDIIRPFTTPILWGGIIAIAAFPLVKWLQPKLGNRRGLTATLVSLVFILILIIPTWQVTEAVLGNLKNLTVSLEDGSLEVPPPNESVRDWPLIGERIHAAWSEANRNLQAFVSENSEQIKELAGKALKRIGSSLMSILIFVVAIIIAGGFMTYAESCGAAVHRLFVRVGGLNPGGEWAPMSVATVRGVLQGVVGIAVIQTILIAIGLVVAGVPGAALWSAIVLVVAIAQLPPTLVLLPIIIWMFSTADTTTAVIFTVYQVIAGSSDTFLKPLLLGRGLDIPMPVILIGAIGGMVLSGVMGLFAGAVVLSITYKLLTLWLEQEAR